MNARGKGKQFSRESGVALRWFVLVIAASTFVIVTLLRKKPDAPAPAPVAMTARTPQPPAPVTPTPEPKPAAAPAPAPTPVQEPKAPAVAVAPKPTPTPAPAPVPAPVEPALDLAAVAASPALWPPAVSLVQPFPFPVVLDGRVVGQATAPVGTALRLVRVNGQQIEVEFQKARHVVPASATDLMERALLILKNGRPAPPVPPVASAPAPAIPPAPVVAALPAHIPEKADATKLAKQIVIEPVPKLATTMIPDTYSKTDNFNLKLKFNNSDSRNPMENLKGEIYIFGESMKDPDLLSLLAVEEFTFSLPIRGQFEKKTKDVKTTYYNSGSYRSGIKFGMWFLRVRSSAGDTVMVKTSSTTLQKLADKVTGLKEGATYSKKTLEESKTTVF
jgi:hypothetical protein